MPTQVIPRAAKRRLKPGELRAWRAFMVASVAVTRAMDRDSQAANGLPLAEHHLLAVLGEAPEAGIRPTDLAVASTLTKSGLTRAVDRLESAGLIERRACPSDGRGQLITLTARGRQTLRRAAPEFFRSVARNFADHVTEREMDALASAFERIAVAGRD
ncbi:MAG: MarR family transcriptional regulator [Chloroflexota bacterium]|nr:MarR family transcriptional regulator [Chloroflexota bacterium]